MQRQHRKRIDSYLRAKKLARLHRMPEPPPNVVIKDGPSLTTALKILGAVFLTIAWGYLFFLIGQQF